MKIYATSLESLYAPLAITGRVIKTKDDFDSYHLRVEVDRDTLNSLKQSSVEEALTVFGDSLRIQIGVIDGDSPAEISGHSDIADYIRDFDNEVKQALFVTINKTALLQRVFPVQSARVVWLLCPTTIETECSRDLTYKESKWFPQCKRIVFLVEKPGCHLEGNWLSILGTDLDPKILQDQIEQGRTEEQCTELTDRAKRRSLETRWLGGVRRLLPEHLFCAPIENSSRYNEIEGPLFKSCMDLIVCSLANLTEPETEGTATGWTARFEGQKQVTVGTLGLDAVDYESCRLWFELYSWVYSASKVNEAMGILRNLLTLQPYDQTTRNYSLLVSWGRELTRSVSSHYTKFVGSSVEQYFAKLKESSTFFQGKIDALNKQVTDLIDAFLKNLLAVFGVVSGTVLVKALDKTAQTQGLLPYLFSAFAVYVAIVGVSYYIVSWKSYRLTKAEYEKNLDVAKSFFTTEDLTKYVGTAFDDRERLFTLTFKWTAGIYGVLFLAGVIGIFITGRIAASSPPEDNPAPSSSPSVAAPTTDTRKVKSTPKAPKSASAPTPSGIVRPAASEPARPESKK